MSEAVPEPAIRKRSAAWRLRLIDRLTHLTALGGALLMVGLLALLMIVVLVGALPAIHKFGWSFLWTTRWSAVKQEFGAARLIYGTLTTAGIALVISFPVSLGSAIFLTKLAPRARGRAWDVALYIMAHLVCLVMGIIAWGILRVVVGHSAMLSFFFVIPAAVVVVLSKIYFSKFLAKPQNMVTIVGFLIELLAAIPSIAYGLWGVFVLVPFMQTTGQPFLAGTIGKLPLIGEYFADTSIGTNIFTAGLVLAIMVTPIMTSIIRDVLAVVPPELEQGALGLGATWWQATRLVLGFSKMGIFGAVILGFARAIGETMAVTMMIGDANNGDKSLFSQGYTIAAKIADQFRNADTEGEVQALIYAAFVLLVITTLINGAARIMVMRLAARAQRKR